MNLSHAYSDHAPKPKSYVGIGLVVALHLAGIYALSAGLIKPLSMPQEPAVLLPPIPDKPREPEPLRDPVKAEKPTLNAPIVEVPVPPIWDEAPPLKVAPIVKGDPPQVVAGGNTAGSVDTPQVTPKADPVIRTAGAVCAVMPKPDLPALNWSGEAVLNVVATVRGGRVVGTEFRVTQGALDNKTRRSLQRAAESALAGYQCQGDAMFQQDFAFRID
jgi:hypothetical protein